MGKANRDSINIINFLFVADKKGTHTYTQPPMNIKQVICSVNSSCISSSGNTERHV